MDQYFTKPEIFESIISILKETNYLSQCDLFVDFSAGNGLFGKLMNENYKINIEQYDLEPKNDSIEKKIGSTLQN